MKKIILMIAALTAGLTMAAQQKGEISVTGTLLLSGGSTMVEVSASGSTQTSKTTNPFAFNLGAGFGYFIMDNVEVSIGGLFYNNASLKTETAGITSKAVSHNITFGFNNVFSPTLGVKYIF